MNRFGQPIENLLEDLDGFTENLGEMSKKLIGVLEMAKKEMSEKEQKVFAQFEKDAIGLDPDKLQKLRDSYIKKFQDAKL